MALAQRQEIIRRLEQVRASRVLVHFLSDRRVAQGIPISGMSTQLAGEPYRLVYEHLRQMGHVERLDLLLHTSGGGLDAVWPLVRLCRSFAKHFSVLVPLRALSGGTLICLGADEVVMCEAAVLSPIDPATANPFNPQEQGRPLPISVEDVTSYFNLAKGDEEEEGAGVGLKSDEHVLAVFKALTDKVHPLALGNVKRVHSQIRQVARRLLQLHIKGDEADERIRRIISILTEELYSHGHLINREEATDTIGGDVVKVPSPEEEAAIWDLYLTYEQFFELHTTFNLKEWLGDSDERDLSANGAVLESASLGHIFRALTKVRRISEVPQGVQIQIPPGQRMPLIPGLPAKVNLEAVSEGWYANTEEA